MLHWHSNDDVLTCTACWSTLGASLPFVCVVTVRWIQSEFDTSDAGSRKYDPFYDASQSVLARLEESTRAVPNIVSPGPVHQSVRRAPSIIYSRDTDDVMVGMHDSTKYGAVPSPRKMVCLMRTASHGRVMCLRTKASAASGGTNHKCHFQPSRTRNLVAPCSDFKTNPAAVPNLRGRRPPPIHSRSTPKLKPNTATTPQVSGDLSADAGQQRLGLAQRAAATAKKSQAVVCQKQTPKAATEVQEAHPQVPRHGSGQTARSVSYDGPTTRDVNCERTTQWTPRW